MVRRCRLNRPAERTEPRRDTIAADTPEPADPTPASEDAPDATEAPESTDGTEETDVTTDATDATDATVAADVTPATPATPAAPAHSWRAAVSPAGGWQPIAAIGGVAAVFAGAFALAGGLGWTLFADHRADQATRAAQQTAIDYAQVLTSINSDEVDQNFDAVLNGATGEFKDVYAKSSMQLRQLLIDNKSAAVGTVVDSAVQSHAKNQVVVLLMVDQKVTNSEMPDPRIDATRMKMTMDKVNGRWLASKVELP